MKIQCPHCGVKGSADDSYQGQKVKCPKCQGIFPALAVRAEARPEIPAPTVAIVETPADLDVPASRTLLEDVAETSGQPPAVAEDTAAAESGLPAEDPDHITVAADTLENDRLPVQADVEPEPVGEREEVLDWSDIVTEIDNEIAEGAKREKEEEGDPATLHGFFENVSPNVDDLGMPAAAQPDAEVPTAVIPAVKDVPAGEEASSLAAPAFPGQTEEENTAEKFALEGVENQPYGMDKEQCWQCGKKDSVGVPFIAKDGRLYCPDCLPPEQLESNMVGAVPPGFVGEEAGFTDNSPPEPRYNFTIGGLLREAWAKTKGAKATVWAGSAVMYLALIILFAGGALLLPSQGNNYAMMTLTGVVTDGLFQLITNAVSVIFSAGLIFMGIRKVAGEAITWKMVFEGFPVAGKLIVATILQTLLIVIGFLLLILPGIYLLIGYAMTVPLIVDRKMSPWQAMEMSRKAIHGEWWKIFGLFIIMTLIFLVSALLLGIGFIWTWPMFVVLGGVVYRSLFGIEKRAM